MIVTSKSNEKIKYINSLKNKKYRDQYGKYILEGIKLVNEYISSEGISAPEFIVVVKDVLVNIQGGKEIYKRVKGVSNLIEVDESVFNYLADTVSSQGILIVINKKEYTFLDAIKAINNGERILILDKIQDPGNLGTIIRTAVSYNVGSIICIKGSADAYSSKVIRSAMGAVEKIKIFYIDKNECILLKENFKKEKYLLVSTDLKADKYLDEIVPSKKTIYVLGNEANGVSNELKDICDYSIKIKMEDKQESLNVGIATGILLYDLYTRGK